MIDDEDDQTKMMHAYIRLTSTLVDKKMYTYSRTASKRTEIHGIKDKAPGDSELTHASCILCIPVDDNQHSEDVPLIFILYSQRKNIDQIKSYNMLTLLHYRHRRYLATVATAA